MGGRLSKHGEIYDSGKLPYTYSRIFKMFFLDVEFQISVYLSKKNENTTKINKHPLPIVFLRGLHSDYITTHDIFSRL